MDSSKARCPAKSGERNKFWESGGFLPTTQRMTNGIKSMDELRSYFSERAQITQNYAKELSSLSSKWTSRINKSAEYGASRDAWLVVLKEPCDLSRCLTDIVANVISELGLMKSWVATKQGDKSAKDHSTRFKIAQKEWNERVGNMDRLKREFENASAKLYSLDLRKSITTVETGQESAKIREKADRMRRERDNLRCGYEEALRLVNERRECYSHEMTRIFQSCQEIERERIEFLLNAVGRVVSCLKLDNGEDIGAVKDKLEALSPEESLEEWFCWNGPSESLPEFEEVEPARSVRPSVDESYRQMAKMSLMDSGNCSPGRAVVALFDYDAEEEDELSLRVGQLLQRFSEEDDNGWVRCADLDGRYGYVPFKFIRDQ